MKRAQKIAPITSLQPPYSMLRRAIEAEILPYAQANGIGVINYSPMLSGLLTGKMTAERIAAMPADDWRRKSVEFKEPRLSQNCGSWSCCARSAADTASVLAWWPWPGRLHHPAITAAIVGGRSGKSSGRDRLPRLNSGLSEEEYEQISAFLAANQVSSSRCIAGVKVKNPAGAGVSCYA